MLEFIFLYLLAGLSVSALNLMSPHLLIFILLIQTLTAALLIAYMKYSLWFSYILFLVFLGGMLVLFTYVAGLASGDLLESLNMTKSIVSFVTFVLLMFVYKTIGLAPLAMSEAGERLSSYNEIITKAYSLNSSLMYLTIVVYLLYALICVAELLKDEEGPLKEQV